MKIAVLGAGAFGTALAVALARNGTRVLLWGRDETAIDEMARTGRNGRRLPGVDLPTSLTLTASMTEVVDYDCVLIAVPMQRLGQFVRDHSTHLQGKHLVSCAKGIDLTTGQGSVAILRQSFPDSSPAVLTGPSFAADIAAGLPTALTLACANDQLGERLQDALSTPVLRLYRTTDVTGAELGGALKNVIAIAAGVVIGAGLGDSARAALMTRGFAEMGRLTLSLGGKVETLGGLSGLGDLVLTCTSDQSRNFRFGRALGRGEPFDETITVEGASTAKAVRSLASTLGLDMPISDMVAALVDRKIAVSDAVVALMGRPLKKE